MSRASLIVLLFLAGCTVGPTYRHPPEVAAAPAWIAQGSAAPVDATWWASFGDPQLTALITAADAGSLDVRTARARLAEARADRDATAGARLPQIDPTGSAPRNRVSEKIGRAPGRERVGQYGQIPV